MVVLSEKPQKIFGVAAQEAGRERVDDAGRAVAAAGGEDRLHLGVRPQRDQVDGAVIVVAGEVARARQHAGAQPHAQAVTLERAHALHQPRMRHGPGGRDDGHEVARAQRRGLQRRAHSRMISSPKAPGSVSVSS